MGEYLTINPDRLAWALADFGRDVGALPANLELTPQKMEAIRARKPALTFLKLQKIAHYFGRDVLFFIDPDPVNEGAIHTPRFRTIQNKKPTIAPEIRKLIELAEWQREVYMGLLEEADDQMTHADWLPDFSGMTAAGIGEETRKWLGITGKSNINTYREALENKGILVFKAQGYKGKWNWAAESPILGFSLYFERFPVIVLKRAEWETRQSFTLMHELGHLILHKAGSIDGNEDFFSHEHSEREANQFAGHVLVPNEILDPYIKKWTHPLDTIETYDDLVEPICRECGVSPDVVLIRLIEAGCITQTEYDEYRTEKAKAMVKTTAPSGGNRSQRYLEPKHILGRRYVGTVLDALNERRITLPKASSYLDDIKVEYIHKLERSYA